MTVPLLILAALAAGLGFIGAPWLARDIHTFLEPSAARAAGLDLSLLLGSNGLALLGMLLAFLLYGLRLAKPASLRRAAGPAYTLLSRKFFIDELYMLLVRGLFFTITTAVAWFDRHVVDGAVNLVGGASKKGGDTLRRTVTGKVQGYALVVFCGVVVALAVLSRQPWHVPAARSPPMRLPLLTIIYCLPLAAVLVMFAIPARRQLAIKTVALCASVAALGLTVWLFFAYDRGAGGLQLVERAPWLGALGVTYFVAVNGINVMLLLLTGIIITAGVLASWDVTERSKEFFILLLTLTTGVFGVFMAYNLFLFFLFYEVAVLPMYLLIGIWGTGRKEYAAMKLTLYLMAGSALILAGILGLYFASGQGSFDFDVLEKTGFDPGLSAGVLSRSSSWASESSRRCGRFTRGRRTATPPRPPRSRCSTRGCS